MTDEMPKSCFGCDHPPHGDNDCRVLISGKHRCSCAEYCLPSPLDEAVIRLGSAGTFAYYGAPYAAIELLISQNYVRVEVKRIRFRCMANLHDDEVWNGHQLLSCYEKRRCVNCGRVEYWRNNHPRVKMSHVPYVFRKPE